MALTEQDLLKVQKAMKEAENDTTPFAIIDGGGEVSVVGDVNKTEVKQYNYSVMFRIPAQFKDLLPGADPILDGKYYTAEIEYKNITITPRKDLNIVSAVVDIIPFLRDVLPSGESNDRDREELSKIVENHLTNDAIVNGLYKLVATVVGVSEPLVDMMMFSSVIDNAVKIILDFPEIFNESDFFTGKRLLEESKE